ncbi:phenylalanine--tRNA ligase subunit beta [Aquimarina agarilytica]|uniref:phenylalanine--tRNA ligase subunit beta n=1 Tax=Aquimarina agarilytica TaxID=1087449 RepID=UPI0002891D7D|nr:phenylalanine--tRNA ligase subunit beta [Aquimarina agarilytica]
MKISYNWLKQFIKIDWDAEKTGELLTDLGLEVEGIDTFESIKGGLNGIVVGHVLECTQHENADKLSVTKVDLGNDQPVQIVCGAPNVAKGQKVAVATIGTKLYTAEGETFTIKKGKIRGEESFGMICAEDELGLGQSHDGIIVLDSNLKPGTPLAEVYEIENDQVFEIGLTPNRADAMSHWGTARDLKAGLQQKGITLELISPSVSSFNIENRLHKIDIKVQKHELAPRYCGVSITGVEVKESPEWLKNRLQSIGLTPKNNIVDITNYVMHELGQPLHAFDAATISTGKINVKTLAEGTKFTTLDAVERKLSAEDLMICDGDTPICIAGVLGGANSGVNETTTQLFLESAYFNPVSIRKTAKRHGLNTDASFRFERGIDPNTTEYALKRATLLIQELAGGSITSDITDLYPKKIEDFQVFLSFENTAKLIGEEIPKETIKSILSSLDIKINNVTEAGLGLTIPAYRNDVQREADVIEEILRVYGYNNIGFTTKLNASIAGVNKIEDYKVQNTIAEQLVGQGFSEIMANSLTTPKYIELVSELNETENVNILNPLSADLSVMRQSLLFSGLEAISYNINRKNADLKLFEFGKTYHKAAEENIENKHLSLFVTGNQHDESWLSPQQKSSFFFLKAIVERIFERMGVQNLQTVPTTSSVFSEGISLNQGNNVLVDLGVVNPKITKSFSVSQPVLFADFNWGTIIGNLKSKNIKVSEISKFQAARRDFALLLNDTITYKQIHDLALKQEKKLLKEVSLFDVYQGKNLPEGKKSYAVSFKLHDKNKTLTDKQIDKIMNKLQQSFEKELGAELR